MSTGRKILLILLLVLTLGLLLGGLGVALKKALSRDPRDFFWDVDP